MNDIRNYILFYERQYAQMYIDPDKEMPKSEKLKALSLTLSSSASELLAVQKKALSNKAMYAKQMEDAQNSVMNRIIDIKLAETPTDKRGRPTLNRDEVRVELYRMLQKKPDMLDDMIKDSNDAKLARMHRSIGDVELVLDSLSSFQNVLGYAHTIYDILKKKAKNTKTDLESAQDIYDKTYAIQKEGQDKLKELNLKLDQLGEAVLIEGWMSKVVDKIKSLFTSREKELKKLHDRAKRL